MTLQSDNPLRDYAVQVVLPVEWGDMDAFRHVNNTVFFRYFESARIAYLQQIGFRDEGEHEGTGPILASTHCRFKAPLTYPDVVRVGARTTEVGSDRFIMEYRVVSEKLERVAADGGGVVVAYNYLEERKAEIPQRVRKEIERIEQRTFAETAEIASSPGRGGR
jgi:acyl-CoA thioester hydrolase